MPIDWRQKLVLLLFLLAVQIAHAGLSQYSSLVVADGSAGARAPSAAIRVTYLGVNGYQLEAGDRALLIDPYFTRVGLGQVGLNFPIAPDRERTAAGLTHTRPRIDAILVTHAHFDHLLDVPEIMRERRSARLVGDATAANLVRSFHIRSERCSVVRPGDRLRVGPWKILVLAAQHDRVIGSNPPYPGAVTSATKAPRKPADWKLGQPLAFVIEANGQRIYIESGGRPNDPLPQMGKIDLAILGVALPDSRRRFASAVRTLQPRYVLPSHQDDFFQPFARGFVFGPLTSFPSVLRTQEKEHLPGRLILLDYFRPWTIR